MRFVVATLVPVGTAACGSAHTTSSLGAPTTVAVPPTTSTTLLTHVGNTTPGPGSTHLVQHIWGTQSILVPVGWVENDNIPGGSSDTVTFNDPTTPANLVLTINACALCGSTPSGQPEPSLYLPKTGVIGSHLLDPYRLAYEQYSVTPNYETDGLIVDLHNGTEPTER